MDGSSIPGEIIAEFTSVVEAVQCAVETQQELSDNNRAHGSELGLTVINGLQVS